MRLRTKLILAFLLLSVLPLSGITAFTYVSSVRAFRETVEAEANAMTADMGERMELVTRDLDRRVEGLGNLPYDAVLARMVPDDDPQAEQFLSGLMKTMGDSAPLLEALEFVPVAAPPSVKPIRRAKPGPARAPSPPEPARVEWTSTMAVGGDSEPVVISLAGLWGDSMDEAATADARGATRVIKIGNVSMLVPSLDRIRIEASDEDVDLSGIVTAAAKYAEIAIKMARSGDGERIAAEIAQTVERNSGEFLRLEKDRERLREMMKSEILRAGDAPRPSRLRIERDFSCAIERQGEVVAEVKARVDTSRVLAEVLSKTRQEQGEIPFALDAEGNIYTPDPAAQETLEEDLDLARLVARGTDGEGAQVSGEWAVVTHEQPDLGLVFGIARPVGESLEQIRGATGRNLIYGLGMIGLAMIGIVPLSTRMTRNLSRLTDGVDRLAAGDLAARVSIGSHDEIGKLGLAFNNMARELTENQSRLLTEERLRKELEMCRHIQDELLPQRSMRLPFADVRAVSIPARELGGDFFNYFALSDGSVALLMGDVSGKGVPAALLMANLQAILRARLPLERNLEHLALSLDRDIEENTPAEAYLTLFVGLIDPTGRQLRYVNAGHNTQYLFGSGGKLERLESGGRPLGLMSGGAYVERSVELHDGDSLCLFTDGLTEAENAAGESFGENRLESLLGETDCDDPDRVVARVEETVRLHRGKIEAADDATLLVLRIDAGRMHIHQ